MNFARILLTTLLTLLLLPAIALAQSGKFSTTITDAEKPTLPVAGAIVEFTPTANPAAKLYYASDGNGVVSLPTLQYGDYTISISFLGYETANIPFTMASSVMTLPEIKLKSSSVEMEAVIKTTKALRASQKGDTLSYNAGSFKVSSDADVEGLLEKMPGIAIEDGEVTAQGEQIKKIYVDGREFFGNDVSTALKSLPAEIVDRIEVYDKLSDSAQMSGVDDGEGEKTINIVTHENMRKGVFGKLFAGGGYEPEPEPYEDITKGKYMGGGSVNLFHGDSRFSVIGLVNNLNQQNFSFEDIMGVTDDSHSSAGSFMVKPLPGVAKVNAVGLNYSDVFGKNDKIKVQGSYFFNQTETTNNESITRWYDESYDEDVIIIDSLIQETFKVTSNVNHRLNGRIDWDISNRSKIMIRPSFSYQANDPISATDGMRYDSSQANENSYSGYNRFDKDGNRIFGEQAFANTNDGYWSGYNVGTSVNYRLALNKAGRNITAGGSFSINNSDNETNYNNELYWKSDGNKETLNDYTDYYSYTNSPSFKRNLSGNLGYSEPLADHWLLNLTYRYSQSYQDTEKRLYETDEEFDPTTGSLKEDASNDTESTYTTHRIGPGIKYAKGRSNFVTSVYYQASSLENETIRGVQMIPVSNDYQNITYSAIGQLYFNPQNSLRMHLYSKTNNPSVSRLQDIINNPSADNITKGNPELDPAYSNQLRLRYIHSNLEKGSTVMLMLAGTRTDNYTAAQIVTQPNDFQIGDDLLVDKDQYTTWVNLDGYWDFYSRLSYGVPVDLIKCNLNLNVGLGYSIIPSIFGGEVLDGGAIKGGYENNTDKISYKMGATLGSNISENVDFTIKWDGNYNEATNIAAAESYLENTNRYYDQTAMFNIKLVFLGGFTFTGNVTYKQYFGITDNYNIQSTICNAFIGRKIFKNRRGEITIGVNDILDQNTSFNRYIASNYTENKQNITLGRYYSAQFTYNLRLFGKGGSTNMRDYKQTRHPEGGGDAAKRQVMNRGL